MALSNVSVAKTTGENYVRIRANYSKSLEGLIEQNQREIKSTESLIKKAVHEKPLIEGRVKYLTRERKELLLRQRLYYSLNTKLHQNYKGQIFRDFLSLTIDNIIELEALSSQPEIVYIKFLSYLKEALQTIPEPGENLIAFIEGYVTRSHILNPMPPQKYLILREYTNGAESTTAYDHKKAKLGDNIDAELKSIDVIEEQLRIARAKRALN